MTTDDALLEMLGEKVGHSIVDSGDYYGRGYERWSKLTLEQAMNRPSATYEAWVDSSGALRLSGSLDMFHFLRKRVAYEEDLTKELWQDDTDQSWLEVACNFAEAKNDAAHTEVGPFNTCNDGCSALTGNFWHCYFTVEDVEYVIIATHNGCDVRWGYSKPRVFRVLEGFIEWDLVDYDVYSKDACLTLHAAGGSIESTYFRDHQLDTAFDCGSAIIPAIEADELLEHLEQDTAYVVGGAAYVPLIYLDDDGEEVYYGHHIAVAYDTRA